MSLCPEPNRHSGSVEIPDEFIPLLESYEQALKVGQRVTPERWLQEQPDTPRELMPSLEELFWLYTEQRNGPASHALSAAALPSIPGYEILQVIGHGGMGIVYKARQVRPNRIVALKVASSRAAEPDDLTRFRTEPEAVARLQHPHILQVYEVGEHEEQPYFSMEFVADGSLAKQLQGRSIAPIPAAQLMEILAGAIHYAHQHGVVHRDLKPGNILVARSDRPQAVSLSGDSARYEPKITDFGLAKCLHLDLGQTRSGAIIGTPSYMAPEQAAGQTAQVGPPADVWGLGAILYELLTGQRPFRGATILETLECIRTQDPERPSRLQTRLPRDLETICLKCLEKEPARRYASAGELADELRRFVRSEPIQARPTPWWERSWKRARRRPLVTGLVAAVALAMLTTGISFAVSVLRVSKAQRATAQAYGLIIDELDQFVRDLRRTDEWSTEGPEKYQRRFLEHVAEYYAKLIPKGVADPRLRPRYASIHFSLAFINSKLGDQAAAERYYSKARELFEQLVHAEPRVPEHQSELARTLNLLGNLYRETGRANQAQQALNEALSRRSELARDYPSADQYQADVAHSHYDLGKLYESIGPRSAAEGAYEAAKAIQEKLADTHPDDEDHQHYLAVTCQQLGELYIEERRLSEAETVLDRGRRIHEKLADQYPGKPQHQLLLAAHLASLGKVYDLQGHVEQSEDAYKNAVKICAKIASAHPNIPEYQRLWATCLNRLGNVYHNQKRFKEGEKAHGQAREIRSRLADEHPGMIAYQSELAETQNNLANLYRATNRLQDAEAAHLAAIAIRERLIEQHPASREFRAALARSQYNLGNLYLATNQPDKAEANYRKAAATYDELAEQYQTVIEYQDMQSKVYRNLCALYSRIGQSDKAAEARNKSAAIVEKLMREHPELVKSTLEERIMQLIQAGRYAEALAELDRAGTLGGTPGPWTRSLRAYVLVRMGDCATAAQEADALASNDQLSAQDLYNLACVYSLCSAAAAEGKSLNSFPSPLAATEEEQGVRGAAEPTQGTLADRLAARAIEQLTRAQTAGFFESAALVEHFKTDPDFEPMRSLDAFKKFTLQLGQLINHAHKPETN